MNNIMDGVGASLTLKKKIANEIKQKNLKPCLAVIQVGDNKASDIYVRNKNKACDMVGIKFINIKLPDTISEDLIITTDDGSYAKKGFAIEFLKKDLEIKQIDCIYACGPLPMLKAIKKSILLTV